MRFLGKHNPYFIVGIVSLLVLWGWFGVFHPAELHAAGGGGISFVQATSSEQSYIGGAGTTSVAFASSTTAGDLIVVAAYGSGVSTYSTGTISDTAGDTFTFVTSSDCGCQGGYTVANIYYAANIKGGPDTVSFNWNDTNWNTMEIDEYAGLSGIDPLDQVNTSSTTGDPVNTGNITTSQSDELLYSVVNSIASSTTMSAGWNWAHQYFGSQYPLGSAYRIVSSTGAYANTFSGMPYGGVAAILSFVAAQTSPTIHTFSASPTSTILGSTSTLSWDVGNASSVAIMGGGVDVTTSTLIGSLVVTPTSTVTYTLSAANANGTSTATSTVKVIVLPSEPQNLTVTTSTITSASLSWSASTDNGGPGIAGYEILRCVGSCTPTSIVATTTATTYTDGALDPDTTYTYAVVAYDVSNTTSTQSASVTAATLAEPWSGIIAPSRAINWTVAGVQGGIPNRTTICATIQPEGSAGSPVAPTNINNAIESCPAGDVIKLAAGSFYLNGPIALADFSYPDSVNNVTLQGAGADQTKLYLYGTSSIEIGGAGNGSQYSASDNWTSGYTQGATQITLSGTAPSVGSVLFLTQCDTGWSGANCDVGSTVDNGSTWICGGGSAFCTHSISGGDVGTRSQIQTVVVKAISGSNPYTVTISPGLYMNNWSASSSPQAGWVYPQAVGNGVQDMSVDVSNATSSLRPIDMGGCYSCWVKGIRIVGGSGDTAYALISVDGSMNYSIVNNYIAANGAGAYPIDSGSAYGYGNGLIMNNITPGLGSDSGGEGNVEAYNYMRSTVIMGSDPLNVAEVFFHHTGGTAYNLMEGNEAARFTADNIHGTHDFPTLFRNWFSDEVPPYSQAQYSGGAIELGQGTRFANVIGNVLGTPGYTTDYQVTPFTSSTNLGHVYQLGLGAALGSQGVMYDSLVQNTLLRWGNYDVVNGSTLWNASDVPSTLDGAVGYQQQIGTGNGASTTFSGTIAHLPCLVGNNAVYDPTDNLYSFDNGTGALTNDVSAGSVNCTTGAVTATFTSAPASGAPIYINYVQQTASSSLYQNPLPSSHALPNSLFLTAKTSPDGGTGLSWWKVCTNYPTCSTSYAPPFPAIGPDVSGGTGPGGLAYNIPAAVAWATLPIDTSYQHSYTITGATSTQQTGIYCEESGLSSPCSEVTLSVSGLSSTLAPVGAFELGGMPSGYACPTTTGECQLTGSNSTAGTVTYALSSSPPNYTSGGSFLYPDIRQFNETVYEADSVAASSTSSGPTISSFSASPASITLGSSTMLSWNVANASSVSISGNNLSFSTTTVSGSTSVTPNATGTLTYTLSAVNGNGATTSTLALGVTAPASATTAPSPPQSLSGSSEDQAVSLSWSVPSSDGGSSLTQYLIYDRLTGSSTFQEVATTSPSVTTNTVSGLMNGISYDFEIAAQNGAGTSTPSNVVTATPQLIYYVDPSSGSDGNSGTSASSSWGTFGRLMGDASVVTPSSSSVTSTLSVTFDHSVDIIPVAGGLVTIPSSTVMTAPTSTDFTQFEATTSVDTSGLPSGYTAVGGLAIGLPSSSLSLSYAVSVTIPVTETSTAPTIFVQEPGSSTWTSIGSCAIVNNACVFITRNFSSFVPAYYTAPSSGGGGGGGNTSVASGGGDGGGGGYVAPSTTSSTASSTETTSSTMSIPTSTAGLQSLLASLTQELHSLLGQAAAEGIPVSGIDTGTSYDFTRNLTVGDTGHDVQALQIYLNGHGFLVNATPGNAGSPGHETDYFGPETQRALAAFQRANGITPPEGYFGPITRNFIASGKVTAEGTASVTSPSFVLGAKPFTQMLTMGSIGSQVSLLQRFLGENPEIYPQDYVTGYFGPDTRMAVQLFQHLYGITPIAYGVVGEATRTELNTLYAAGERP